MYNLNVVSTKRFFNGLSRNPDIETDSMEQNPGSATWHVVKLPCLGFPMEHKLIPYHNTGILKS